MKIAALIIGILLMLLSFIGLCVSFALPQLTSNKVNFEESLIGVGVAVFFLFIGFVITLIGAVLFIKEGKKAKLATPMTPAA